MDVNKLDVWLSNAFQALPTELACGVAPRDRVKGQYPHFITKIVLVSQKKNKDICISVYDVDLLVTTESRISGMEDNPRRCPCSSFGSQAQSL